jgi:hypothetical protein
MPDPLLNHRVGAFQQPGRKFDPEHLRRFEVEGKLDSCGLLHREVGPAHPLVNPLKPA